ncbi:hypothetical protein ABPG75_009659 [Micractinium tetrahymenae]
MHGSDSLLQYVDDDVDAKFSCAGCGCDIASEKHLLWEGFMGHSTSALLFRCSVNLAPCGNKREEMLTTGRYTLADMHCHVCQVPLGWKYLSAQQEDQQYKVGAVLLQQSLLRRVSNLQAITARTAYARPPPAQQAQRAQ